MCDTPPLPSFLSSLLRVFLFSLFSPLSLFSPSSSRFSLSLSLLLPLHSTFSSPLPPSPPPLPSFSLLFFLPPLLLFLLLFHSLPPPFLPLPPPFPQRWKDQEAYIDHLLSKLESSGANEVAKLKESEAKLQLQIQESTRRENVLNMRLATKQQEMQELVVRDFDS